MLIADGMHMDVLRAALAFAQRLLTHLQQALQTDREKL